MRYKEPYTLYPVSKNGGKAIYYYRTYDENGKRTSGKSTGQTSKGAARTYVDQLIREGRFSTNKDKTFGEYSDGWWIWEKCIYIKTTLATGGNISRDYADIARGYLRKHIIPTFNKMKLTEIQARHIEEWRMKLLEDRGLSAKTVNNVYAVLRKMLNEAERLDYIQANPTRKIKPLHEKSTEKSFLTIPEIKKLFNEDLWDNNTYFIVNILAAFTGIRLGEAVALHSEQVYENYISIIYSYSRKYGLKETKTKDKRHIPIPSMTSDYLQELKKSIPRGFIFSSNGGVTPVYYRSVTDGLYKALAKIGISDEERRRRNITFHSWRHFFNSFLRSRGIADNKIQKLTGHKTQEMTEHYTHFQPEDFKDVLQIQETVLNKEADGHS